VGSYDGLNEGTSVGFFDGLKVGSVDGFLVGLSVGSLDGLNDGLDVGIFDGVIVDAGRRLLTPALIPWLLTDKITKVDSNLVATTSLMLEIRNKNASLRNKFVKEFEIIELFRELIIC